jgi:hypothetical protein
MFVLRAKCLAGLDQYDSAFISLSKGYELDSLLSQLSLKTRISAVEAAMLERENISKIQAQDDILRYQHEEILDARLIMAAFSLVVILGLILFVALLNISKQRRKINALLSDRVAESTFELSSVHYSLIHSHDTLRMLVTKLESELRAEHATIMGLRVLLEYESDSMKGKYVEMTEQLCLRLVKMVREFRITYLDKE